MPELLGRRLRQAVRFLIRQAARRARQETQLKAELQIHNAEAETQYAESAKRIEETFSQAQERAVQTYQQSTQKIQSRFSSEHGTKSRQWTEHREKRDEEYTRAKAKRDADFDEARWTVDTILEADKKVARENLELQQRRIGTTVQEIRARQSEFKKLAVRWKLTKVLQEADRNLSEGASPGVEPADVGPTNSNDPFITLKDCAARLDGILEQMRRLIAPKLLKAPRLFSIIFFFWLLSLAPIFWMDEWYYWIGATVVAAVAIGVTVRLLLLLALRTRTTQFYLQVKQTSKAAAQLQTRSLQDATDRYKEQLRHAQQKHEQTRSQAENDLREALDDLRQQHQQELDFLEDKYGSLLKQLEDDRNNSLQKAETAYQRATKSAGERYQADLDESAEKKREFSSSNREEFDRNWKELTSRWRQAVENYTHVARQVERECRQLFPDWEHLRTKLRVPKKVPLGMPIGTLDAEPKFVAHGIPQDPELRSLTPPAMVLPALLDFPQSGSLVLKAQGEARDQAVALLQAVMLRCLLALPPGKVRFTIVDPVGLGDNFAAFSHLADFDEKLVAGRIWTEPSHIEKCLAKLTEHIEIVIQKYLRNQFESLEEYNAQAGEMAEPYRILVVAHFPANFTQAAAKRLVSIAQSGLRCGVNTFVLVDTQQPLPDHFDIAEIERNSAVLEWPSTPAASEQPLKAPLRSEERGRGEGSSVAWRDPDFGAFPLKLDAPPNAEICTELLHRAGELAKAAGRVEVPFQHIAPLPEEWWTGNTHDRIRVALGRAGATRKQYLDLGEGTSQHTLIAGKTGSGKSTLLHALIVQLALAYSPDEIELYLVDFKKGVEFKTYAAHELPHARVVAVESEREFGLSVLKRLDQELKLRGEKFRNLGVHDLQTYRDAAGEKGVGSLLPARPDGRLAQKGPDPFFAGEALPRIMLIVDEFQEFFVEDDRVAQEAALLLDRLVRQGRAFGMHVLLGSQTLGGAYSLARSTIDQMAVRIALQCSETDGHLILSKDNAAARLLSRPGEAIYNDANGLVEGNNLFQVVWMPDRQRDEILRRIQKLARQRNYKSPPLVVFEGNAPSQLERNSLLYEAITTAAAETRSDYPAWLGDAIAIKEPTAAVFHRQSGSNLLLAGQHVEAALGIFTASFLSLCANVCSDDANGETPGRFYLLCDESVNADAAQLFSELATLVPHPVQVISWRDVPVVVAELAEEVERRIASRELAAPIFFFVHGLQHFRDLRRREDDFGFLRRGEEKPQPSQQFAAIVRDGPSTGVFTMAWCDTYNNIQRFLDRQLLREFEMRVLFQMNANDSSNLIDSPIASRLGLHRALYYTEDQGKTEKFRPYGLPPMEWLEWVRERMHKPSMVGS